MRNRLKKEDYITEETKSMETTLKLKIKEDKERAIVKNILSKLSLERKQILLQELSLELSAKSTNQEN